MAQLNEAYEVLSNPGAPLVSFVSPADPRADLLNLLSFPPSAVAPLYDHCHGCTELRARFDAGDDPNDPTSGRGGGGFPGGFSSGGQPIFFQSGGSGGGGPAFQQFFQQAAGADGGGQFFQQFAGGGGGGGGGGQQFQFRWG